MSSWCLRGRSAHFLFEIRIKPTHFHLPLPKHFDIKYLVSNVTVITLQLERSCIPSILPTGLMQLKWAPTEWIFYSTDLGSSIIVPLTETITIKRNCWLGAESWLLRTLSVKMWWDLQCIVVSWSLNAGSEPVEWKQKCFSGGNYVQIWGWSSFRCTIVYNKDKIIKRLNACCLYNENLVEKVHVLKVPFIHCIKSNWGRPLFSWATRPLLS